MGGFSSSVAALLSASTVGLVWILHWFCVVIACLYGLSKTWVYPKQWVESSVVKATQIPDDDHPVVSKM